MVFFATAAENAANSIIDWCAEFGSQKGLMSDGPTNFRNESLRLVSKGLNVPHHFTLAYTTLSNSSVERLGRELVRVFRSVLSELQIDFKESPDLVPLMKSALNQSP